MTRILLIEDDPRIGSLILVTLRSAGYDTAWRVCGADGLAHVRAFPTTVVVLDLGLPDLDGIDVCRQLRAEQPDLLIVMLTARGEDIDVIAGLEAGADDYVTKPFGMRVLLARVAAHLRRIPAPEGTQIITDGDLQIDPAARRCMIARQEVHLRAKQFDLLHRLARDLGCAVSRQDLMHDVWDEHWDGSTKTLDVHIAQLRQRLAHAADQAAASTGQIIRTPRLTTVRTIGYRLDHHDSPPSPFGRA